MANEFIARNGLISQNNSTITGSLTVTGGITGSLFGTSSYATTASNILGGTGNYISLWNTATSLTTSSIYQSGNNIGLGTTSPYTKLHIEGSASGPISAYYRSMLYVYNTSTSISYPNSIGLYAKVATSDGYAVYGESTETTGYGGYFVGRGFFSQNVDIVGQGPKTLTIEAGSYGGTEIRLLPNSGGTAKINVGNSNYPLPLDFQMNSVDVMRITQDGNVGIGTTTPNAKLDVNGNALIKTAFIGTIPAFGDNYTSFSHISRTGSDDYSLLSDNAGITYLNAKSNQDIRFRINNIDKAILSSSGDFGIGTTTPNAKLDVNGNVIITGSLNVTQGITGSLFGTASFATTASYALNAGGGGVSLGLVQVFSVGLQNIF